ncbi:hypothetical protein [Solibacillus sp. FSL H8-0538]|uniref:hypothetical protein n=1 Tax=Solibacillus sp. FSL H8-0538 TaxID=2921400 RepID=UPI0030FD186B
MKGISQIGSTLSQHISRKNLIKVYAACQWWLGKEWLNQEKGTHPIQIMWQNPNWASDTELYLIGYSILYLRKQGHKRTDFDGKKTEILGKQISNQNGYIFELLVSTLFSENKYKVQLLPPSAQGYDLDITTLKGTELQVSCKVCLPSDNYYEFETYSKDTENKFIQAQKDYNVTGWTLTSQVNRIDSFPTLEQIKFMFGANIERYFKQQEPTEFICSDNYYSFKHRLPTIPGTQGYSLNNISYDYTSFFDFSLENELSRIDRIIKKANAKFKDVTKLNKKNITVIKIPRYLDITNVCEHFLKRFKNNYSSTSGIIFLQSHILYDPTKDTLILNTTVEAIYNLNGQFPWNSNETLDFVIPIGSSSKISPKLVVGNKNEKIKMTMQNKYIYQNTVESYLIKNANNISPSYAPGLTRIFELNDGDIINTQKIPFDLTLI